MLSNKVGRPVMDATGRTGKFDFVLTGRPGRRCRLRGAVDAQGPAIFSAIQEQLGLRLESKRGSFEILVVDQAAKTPTEN